MSDETTCPSCGQTVPAGNYCGACGAHLAGAPLRQHAFAANPNEHILHPSIASVLFPHLPHSRSLPYRLALLAVIILLMVFGYLRLSGATVAIVVAAVPALYLLYLYEVEAYEGDPLYTVGITAGVGALLGAGWAFLTGPYVTQTLLLQSSLQGVPLGRIVLAAVAIPLVAQILMLVGALIIRVTRPYDEVLDGFVFGVTAAVAFAFGFSLINLLPEIRSGPLTDVSNVSAAMRSLLHGFLLPLIDAATTG